MPTNLTGTTPSVTFNQLLHVDGGVTATEKTVFSGSGVATALKVGTQSVSVDNVQINGNALAVLNSNGSLFLTANGSGRVVATNCDLLPGSTVPFSSVQNRVHAQVSSTSNQTGSTTTQNKVTFTNVEVAAGVTGVPGGDISVAESGVYLIASNLQFANSDSQDHDATVWVAVGGTNVDRSARRLTVPKLSDGGSTFYQNVFYVNVASGQAVSIFWLPENTSVTLAATAAGAIAPAIPSATLVIERIA
jgi:hypothetical protein